VSICTAQLRKDSTLGGVSVAISVSVCPWMFCSFFLRALRFLCVVACVFSDQCSLVALFPSRTVTPRSDCLSE